MNVEKVKATAIMGEMSPESARLVEVLKDGIVGDVLTDERLTKICGKSTASGGSGYGNLQTAIKWVQNHKNLVWRRVRGGACIKCLGSSEIAGFVEKEIDNIRHKTKRTLSVSSKIKIDDIAESERSKVLANIAQLGTIHIFAKNDTTTKLIARNVTAALSSERLLGAFEK